MPSSIAVKHNIEVAHRLFELPGKCEQIHGHSMWVTMHLEGEVNNKGILGGIEFGDLKKLFRSYLDTEYDHRLLLNRADPFSRPIYYMDKASDSEELVQASEQMWLPGLQTTEGDPTTENLARWIGEDMVNYMGDAWLALIHEIRIEVWETSVNMASWGTSL